MQLSQPALKRVAHLCSPKQSTFVPFIFAFSLTPLPQLPFLPACAQPLCTLSRSSSPARLFSLIYFSHPLRGRVPAGGRGGHFAGGGAGAALAAARWRPCATGRGLALASWRWAACLRPVLSFMFLIPLCARPTVSHTELEALILVYVSPLLAASHSPPSHQSSPSCLMSLLQKIRSSSHPCR